MKYALINTLAVCLCTAANVVGVIHQLMHH